MVALAAVVGMVVSIALAVAAHVWIRNRAERIERSAQPVDEKVHRLQRLMLSVFGAVFAVFAVVIGVTAPTIHAVGRHSGASTADRVLVLVATLVIFLVSGAALFVLPRAVRRALARVRDVPVRVPVNRRQVLIALAGGLCYAAILTAGMLLVPRHGTGHVVGRMLVYIVGLLIFVSLIAPLVIVRARTVRMDDEPRDRLTRLADDIGVRIRDFRVVKARGQKVANAAQVGTLPGLRYVIVTDYLLDHLDPSQLDAVVAHELGHARRHHLLIKLGAIVIVWAVLEALVVAIRLGSGHAMPAVLVAPVIIAFPLGLILVQGLVGVRLETAADDVAAEQVGAEPLAAALEEIGRLNNTKRNTGRGWAILTQHPGLQDRLEHLQGAATHRVPSTS